MAANLKIGIIADDGNAQKKFEGLSTSVDMTAKSVTQLANQFAKLNAAKVNILNTTKNTKELSDVTSAMTTTYKQLMNAIERQKISWGTTKDSVASLKKELAELEKVETLLISKGVGSSMSGELEDLTALTDKYAEYKKELQGVIKLKEEEEKLAAQKLTPSSILSGVQGTAEYKKNGLLGDNLSQMKQEYEAYSEALTKIINTLGAGSPEAERMASAMNELNKKIKDCSTQTTATTKRIGNLIKNFVSAQMIVWAIRKAFTSLVSTLKESAEAAAEAEETYNLFITTFENASIAAESAANRLASSLGMANSTAQEALGTFGDLAAGYGATDKEALEFGETATQVAMDIISYKNISGDTATTLQSIASGLAGNVENFRKLGYVMTQAEVKTKLQQKGLDKLTGSSLQYAQIQARLEILQEKSVKAQGDMIKTLDSTTNVTRRLSEAWKEYEENLGESVNVVLNPIKRTWLEILESINKANKAQEEFNKNGSGNNTYDVGNNARDWGDFTKKIQDTWGGTTMASYNAFSVDSNYDSSIDRLADIMLLFSATPEQTVKAMVDSGLWSSGDSVLGKIQTSLKSFYDEWEKEEEKRQKKEDAKNEAISAIQSAMSFIDNLNSINGVYGDDSSLSRRLANTQNGVVNITSLEGDTQTVVDNLLANLSSASADSFVSALDIALGREDTESMLEAKLASVEEVYEALWNEFYSSGEELTEWQKGALEETLELAKSLNGQIENLNKEEKKVSADTNTSASYKLSLLSSSLSSAITALASLETSSNSYFIQGAMQEYVEDIAKALEEGLSNPKAFDKLWQDIIDNLNGSNGLISNSSFTASDFNSSDPYSFLTDIQKATGENTLLDALEAQLSAAEEYYENVKTFYKADGVISEEEQAALNDILAMVTGIYEKKEKEANKEEPEEGADASSLLGEWATLAENPLQWLIDLLAQTEAVQKFGTLLSDSILPALNACLEPMLPALEMMGSLIQNLVLPALEILFPVIKQIAYVITWVAGSVNVAIGFISDTVKYVVGNMVYGITETLNKAFGWLGVDIDNKWAKDWSNVNILGNAQSRIDEMNEHLAEIDKMSMQIEKNTSEDEMDLTVLNKLFESGILSRDEMNALRASYLGQTDPGKQTQLLASTAGDYATYLRSGGTSNVSYGDVSIEINSESGDPEKIAKEVARVLEEWQRNGKKSFSVAIA